MRVPLELVRKISAGELGLESPSQFMRLAQPIETKWKVGCGGLQCTEAALLAVSLHPARQAPYAIDFTARKRRRWL